MAEEKEKVMLFNSIEFAIFLPSIFIIYWFVTKTTKYFNFTIKLYILWMVGLEISKFNIFKYCD